MFFLACCAHIRITFSECTSFRKTPGTAPVVVSVVTEHVTSLPLSSGTGWNSSSETVVLPSMEVCESCGEQIKSYREFLGSAMIIRHRPTTHRLRGARHRDAALCPHDVWWWPGARRRARGLRQHAGDERVPDALQSHEQRRNCGVVVVVD